MRTLKFQEYDEPRGNKRRGPKMTIEIIAIPGSVFLAAAMVARLYELRNDVLYGPYIAGRKHPLSCFRDDLVEIAASIGLQRAFSRVALKVGTVGFFASAIIG